jgi:hypothetical protein
MRSYSKEEIASQSVFSKYSVSNDLDFSSTTSIEDESLRKELNSICDFVEQNTGIICALFVPSRVCVGAVQLEQEGASPWRGRSERENSLTLWNIAAQKTRCI